MPELQRLKFQYFGHDQIVFHERDIRRQSGEFVALRGNPQQRQQFLSDISDLIASFEFDLAASVVNKQSLANRYANPMSPYDIALLLNMEHLALTLRDHDQLGRTVHVIAESRGTTEDRELELAFRRIADGNPPMPSNQRALIAQFDWQIVFRDKKSNSSGLQIADLIARPVGLHVLHPEQSNRAYEIIADKVNWWIKTFP